MIKSEWLTDNLEDAFNIRREVFVKEQNIPEDEEFDDLDKESFHLVIYDGKIPVATGRLILKDKAYLGRIAVLKEHRKNHFGDFLIRIMIRKAYEMGYHKQYLGAQVRVQGFYEKLGFKPYGEEYLDSGIPHIHMYREGDITGNCGD